MRFSKTIQLRPAARDLRLSIGLTCPVSDSDMMVWAREHLVYEGRMLAFATVRLAERHGVSRDPESNVLLEAFVMHARCLRDFLWGEPKSQQPNDAFAADFCAPGRWNQERGSIPLILARDGLLHRAGREVAHLSYRRLAVGADSKDWSCREIYDEIAAALQRLAVTALPTRLDEPTRRALHDLLEHRSGVSVPALALGAVHAATVAFPGFTVGM